VSQAGGRIDMREREYVCTRKKEMVCMRVVSAKRTDRGTDGGWLKEGGTRDTFFLSLSPSCYMLPLRPPLFLLYPLLFLPFLAPNSFPPLWHPRRQERSRVSLSGGSNSYVHGKVGVWKQKYVTELGFGKLIELQVQH
jgi:hypothetical protein